MDKIDKQNQTFETTNLSLCAALCCKGYEIDEILKDDGGKATFILTLTEDLEDLVWSFWNKQLSVDALTFYNIIRGIKNRIIQA